MVQKTSEFSKMFRKHNDFHTVFSNKITSQSLLSKFIRSLIDCNITLTFVIKRIEGSFLQRRLRSRFHLFIILGP